MMRYCVLAALVICVLVGSVQGFNGERKGFVLGGGVGFAPSTKWNSDAPYQLLVPPYEQKSQETNSGPGLHFVIGYAWDEHNMIVYDANGTYYKSDFFLKNEGMQTFNGVSWYHYFGPTGRAFFTSVGVGLYAWKVKDVETPDPGPAFLLGFGFEFVRHVQAGLFYVNGKTSQSGMFYENGGITQKSVDIKHSHFNIVITAVAF